jgi:hypothetical protein
MPLPSAQSSGVGAGIHLVVSGGLVTVGELRDGTNWSAAAQSEPDSNC